MFVENVANQCTASFPITSSLAVIESESLLVDIAKQMEGLDTHIGPVKSTFEQGPKAFHIVSMDIAVYIFDGVIHYGVLILRIKAVIGFQLITKDCRASFNVLTNLLLKFLFGPVVHDEGTNVAATLHHSHNNCLILAASAGDHTFPFVLVHKAGLATDESFVYFNLARQLSSILALHRKPDPMEHEARGFL